MGFGHLPQWQRHNSKDGQCVYCQQAIPHDGTVCTKADPGGNMTYLGDLPWATNCRGHQWIIFLFIILFASSAFAADIAPAGFTATWDVPADQTVQYEFRVSNFALPAPLSLGVRPSMPNRLTFTFTSPLPNVPDTGRWECLDVRIVKNGVPGPWLSETPGGAACGQVALSAITPAPIPVPTPPAPIPQPVPHGLVIATQTETALVITASAADCPKGISTSTAGSTKTKPKRTLTCLR